MHRRGLIRAAFFDAIWATSVIEWLRPGRFQELRAIDSARKRGHRANVAARHVKLGVRRQVPHGNVVAPIPVVLVLDIFEHELPSVLIGGAHGNGYVAFSGRNIAIPLRPLTSKDTHNVYCVAASDDLVHGIVGKLVLGKRFRHAICMGERRRQSHGQSGCRSRYRATLVCAPTRAARRRWIARTSRWTWSAIGTSVRTQLPRRSLADRISNERLATYPTRPLRWGRVHRDGRVHRLGRVYHVLGPRPRAGMRSRYSISTATP